MSPTVRATVRVSTSLYQNLVTAYEKLSKKTFEKAVNDHQDALRGDSLHGLARQALAAIDKHRIRQLTEVSRKKNVEKEGSLLPGSPSNFPLLPARPLLHCRCKTFPDAPTSRMRQRRSGSLCTWYGRIALTV
jgi:hypothetical protein